MILARNKKDSSQGGLWTERPDKTLEALVEELKKGDRAEPGVREYEVMEVVVVRTVKVRQMVQLVPQVFVEVNDG